MIPINSILRVARPTDNLELIGKMYSEGLGFEVIGSFSNHENFDGIILGHKNHPYHLEFTHHHGTNVGKAPTMDHLIIFYIPNYDEWKVSSDNMIRAGFKSVKAFNPYWDVNGKTFEDIDGYRVVLQNKAWAV